MSDFHVCEKCGADFQCFSSEPHVCLTSEERYGPSCRHCGNHLCNCRKSADDIIRDLRETLDSFEAQLAERARELKEANNWIDHVRKQCGVTGEGSIIELVNSLQSQRLDSLAEYVRLQTELDQAAELLADTKADLEHAAQERAERTRERDEHRSRCERTEEEVARLREALHLKTAALGMALADSKAPAWEKYHTMEKERDEARAESARLRELLRGVLRGSVDCNDFGQPCNDCDWCRARQALAKETT